MKINFLYLFYFFLYLLVFIFSLNYVYIEGDDASTIVYHAMGRNLEIQTPYSSYHSMFDKFLSLFNTKDEIFLRYVAISISFLFNFFSLVFLVELLKEKIEFKKSEFLVFLCMLPFVIPEILFSGLIINPSIISFAFLILSHLFLIKYLKTDKKKQLLFSILIFGLAVSFRWSSAFYLFIFVGELFLNNSKQILKSINFSFFFRKVLILFLYTISFLLFIYLSGYSVIDIYMTYAGGKEYLEHKEISYLATFSSALSFLTPSFIILFFLGLFFVIKTKKIKFILTLILGLVPFFNLGVYPSYKYLVVLVPYLTILIAYGFFSMKNKIFKYALLLIVLLPWIFGIQLKTNSSWGPGFEILHKGITSKKDNKTFNPDNYINFNNINIVLGSGMAIPTPEGPRPIYGFGKVFFKDWKEITSKIEKEKENAVDHAISNKIDILQDVGHSFITTKLLEKGFSTETIKHRTENYIKRVFFRKNDTIDIIIPKDKKMLLNNDFVKEVLIDKKQVVVYTSYTNLIVKQKQMYPNNFKINGAYFGILKNFNNEKR